MLVGKKVDIASESDSMVKTIGNRGSRIKKWQYSHYIYMVIPYNNLFIFFNCSNINCLTLKQDVNSNRIGQWVNTTSNGKILQLSHPLSSEAPKGSYSIVVSTGGNKVYHSFKVEHYGK